MSMKRRRLIAAAAAVMSAPTLASSRRLLAPMTDGPFYPPPRWRNQWPDWDADLTRVQRDGGRAPALGEHLGLELNLADRDGRLIDGAEVEIWQCDALAVYHHPQGLPADGRRDAGFQGFGSATTGTDGKVRFRTIRPVPYPGRTPHIHVKLRQDSFGEVSSQLFVAGDPGNARDFLWRRLAPADQQALAMTLTPASGDGLRWQARHALILPA